MIKIIKLDKGSRSYIFDKSTDEKVSKIDFTNENLRIHIDDKTAGILEFDMNQVSKQYGGLYYIINGDDKYLLDDGYFDVMLQSGYLVLGDYDKNSLDKMQGSKVLSSINDDVARGIKEFLKGYLPPYMKVVGFTKSSLEVESMYYSYSIYVDTIGDIINDNQKRKLNDLPYYPYLRNMDKYGTLYIRVFGRMLPSIGSESVLVEKGINKYSDIKNLLKNFIICINSLDSKDIYHFEPVVLKKMIIKE